MLEYENSASLEAKLVVYNTIDVYPQDTVVLYSLGGLGGFRGPKGFGSGPKGFGKPFRGSGLEFHPSNKYGIGGGGIARNIKGSSGLVERVRYNKHPPLGPHLNYHTIVPYNKSKNRPILSNAHIEGIPKNTFSYLKRINRYLPKSFRVR